MTEIKDQDLEKASGGVTFRTPGEAAKYVDPDYSCDQFVPAGDNRMPERICKNCQFFVEAESLC